VAYVYYFFHHDDMENVINVLKNSGISLKPKFDRHRYVEIVASNSALIGKYKNIGFLFFSREVEIEYDFLKKVTVEIAAANETFYDSRMGRYAVEDDGELLRIDREFDEEFFVDFIPAMYTEFIKSEILLNECNLLADVISREETEIIKRIKKLSAEAEKSTNMGEIESFLAEVSGFQTDFFKKFMEFKDVNEELFSAMMNFDVFARGIGGWFIEKSENFKDYFERLKYFESKFEQTLNGIRDLFTLASLKLDTLRNREYLELQKRTSSLQAAAAIIEFVAVYYYTMKIWEHFLPIETVPKILSFLMLTFFTTSIVVYTEALSELIRERRVTRGFVVVTFLLIIILFLMVYTPLIFSAGASLSAYHLSSSYGSSLH
jgi:hypothetical protein